MFTRYERDSDEPNSHNDAPPVYCCCCKTKHFRGALLCATANIKNCPNVAPAEYSNNHTGHGKYEQHQRLPREMRIEKKQGTYILYDECCCCCCLGCRCWVYALYSTAVVRRVQSTPPEHVQRGGLGATLWGVSTEKNAVPGGSKQQTAD